MKKFNTTPVLPLPDVFEELQELSFIVNWALKVLLIDGLSEGLKIVNGLAPSYLSDILPPQREDGEEEENERRRERPPF